MMIDFQESLPDGFREKLSSRLVTMSEVKIKKWIAEAKLVYNTEVIFARAMYLISIDRIDLEQLFQRKWRGQIYQVQIFHPKKFKSWRVPCFWSLLWIWCQVRYQNWTYKFPFEGTYPFTSGSFAKKRHMYVFKWN